MAFTAPLPADMAGLISTLQAKEALGGSIFEKSKVRVTQIAVDRAAFVLCRTAVG
jgi:hypothetical protein